MTISWRSVKKKLPRYNQRVIVYNAKYDYTGVDLYLQHKQKNKKFEMPYFRDGGYDIEYWLPLPPKPR